MSDLVDRLHNEAAMWRGNGDENLCALLDEAAAEIEQLRADAARYRWLRDNAMMELEFSHQYDEAGCTLHFHCEWIEDDPELDRCVDEAMLMQAHAAMKDAR